MTPVDTADHVRHIQSEDVDVLRLALREMSLALDALAAECVGDFGNPKAPSRQTLMRCRGLLPPYCSQAQAKRQNQTATAIPSGSMGEYVEGE